MTRVAYGGKIEGARKLIAAGGHRVAISALGAFSTNAVVLAEACFSLYWIVVCGDVNAKAAIRAVDGTFMDKLRQAYVAIQAAGICMYDWDVCFASILL